MYLKQFAFSEGETDMLRDLVDGELRHGYNQGTAHMDYPEEAQMLLDLLDQLTFKIERKRDTKADQKAKPKTTEG